MDKDKLKQMLDKEKIGISAQGLELLDRLEDKEKIAKEMIKAIKERKWIISGGDVLFYLQNDRLPTAPIVSGGN